MSRPLKTSFSRFASAVILAAFLGAPAILHAQIGAPKETITPQQQEQAKAAAQGAAAAWLRLLDAGEYAQTWQTAANSFHIAITQDGWIALLKGGQPTFGNVVLRKLKAVNFTRILVGAPDSQYVVIQYDTEFSKLKSAVETITTGLQPDGSWKVDGYHIK